jgi:alkylation response protein AidB-like acyl-CoA dehydrogenase
LSLSTDNDADCRDEFRRRFARVRAEHDLHPTEHTPASTFEAAANCACAVAEDCLPLGIAVVMHLYPLGAMRCVPLPWWSVANLRRTLLLRAIDSRSLILANAGSERANGAHAPVKLARRRGGIHVNGTYDYVSLANVADIVLFNAPLAGSDIGLFCAADLRGDAVRIGGSKFAGSMRLSDTCSVAFENQRVPADRCLEVPGVSALHCMAQYQRSWFQLLLGVSYLARIERLRRQWDLPRTPQQIADLNELACLREYALRLLDDAASPGAIESLTRLTAFIKLRVSWLAQTTATALRGVDDDSANELRFLRLQPTSDGRILRSIGAPQDSMAAPMASSPAPAPIHSS